MPRLSGDMEPLGEAVVQLKRAVLAVLEADADLDREFGPSAIPIEELIRGVTDRAVARWRANRGVAKP